MKTGDYYLKRCPFCGGKAVICDTCEGLYQASCECCNCGTPSYNTKIAAARRWNQRTEACCTRWISCEERLPDNNHSCIVICRTWNVTENAWKSGTLMIMRYLVKEQRWNISGMADVTHWMPMPEFQEE